MYQKCQKCISDWLWQVVQLTIFKVRAHTFKFEVDVSDFVGSCNISRLKKAFWSNNLIPTGIQTF